MSVQLLSISSKTAPVKIRELFAFDKDKQEALLKQLVSYAEIDEAVFLSTCNRVELYCSGKNDNHNLKIMQNILLEEAELNSDDMAHKEIMDYILRFYGRNAIHHLFLVTAGLDSVVIGEDQILGQVKQAYFFAKERGTCQSGFNTLFRMAVTAAKKVKTDTLLSKTPVSTASLALKKAIDCHGSLRDKNVCIIGASGNIGRIVLKDAMAIEGIKLFVTVRSELPHELRCKQQYFTTLAYEQRYEYMDDMDVVISATTSPHYTITKKRFLSHIKTQKKRVLFDLAIPYDIENEIGTLENTLYFSMEDMEELARYNNQQKLHYVDEAQHIISKYEHDYLKNAIWRNEAEAVEKLKQEMIREADKLSIEKMADKLIYKIKKESSLEEFEGFINIVKKLIQGNGE